MSYSKHSTIQAGFLLIFAVALLPLTASSQFRNSITGFVFTQDRQAVGQMNVELMNDVYQVLKRTRTDGSGRYVFSGISSGRFVVRVITGGTNFEEQSQEVEIVNIMRPGGTTTSEQAFKDFYLKVRKRADDAPTITGTVFVQDVPSEARKLYEKGVADLETDRAESGLESLVAAVKVFPEYYAALESLGREYLRLGNYEYAQAVFTKMVSVNDRSITGWYGLGYSAYALKKSVLAVEAASRAARLGGESAGIFLLLGNSYRQAKKYAEAETALLKSKSLAKGTLPDVHWNLALLYAHNLNRFADAANELELYLKFSGKLSNEVEIKKLIAYFRTKAAG